MMFKKQNPSSCQMAEIWIMKHARQLSINKCWIHNFREVYANEYQYYWLLHQLRHFISIVYIVTHYTIMFQNELVITYENATFSLQWRRNERDSVSNHQPHDCILNRLFRRRSKKTSKLRVTGLLAGNSPGTGEFPAKMASSAENISIWWRHHVIRLPNL